MAAIRKDRSTALVWDQRRTSIKDEGYGESSSNICLCEGSEFPNIPKISQAIQHVRISLCDCLLIT